MYVGLKRFDNTYDLDLSILDCDIVMSRPRSTGVQMVRRAVELKDQTSIENQKLG